MRERDEPGPELARHLGELKTEKILELRDRDEYRDAVGESYDDRPWNELDGRAHPGRAEHDENDAGHQGAHEQPVDAMSRDDARDDHDERAGRPADLEARAAERRD